MAEHCPIQLMPRPQVTLVRVLSGAQQLTWIVSFENAKAYSKKSMLAIVVMPGKHNDFWDFSCKFFFNIFQTQV